MVWVFFFFKQLFSWGGKALERLIMLSYFDFWDGRIKTKVRDF